MWSRSPPPTPAADGHPSRPTQTPRPPSNTSSWPPSLHRLAPPRHPCRARPSLLHPATPRPKSGCAGLTLYAILRLLQRLLVVMTGACHVCNRPFNDSLSPDDTT